MRMNKTKILFLDRDGTIIKDKGYMYRPEDIEFIEKAVEAMVIFQKNYQLVVVTNQSGIGRGRYKVQDYEIFNKAFLMQLHKRGVSIRALLYCPHSPEDNCRCRKPKTWLVNKWLKNEKLELDVNHSYVIGDKQSDVELASNLGIKGILISRAKGIVPNKNMVISSLYEATEIIL